MFSKVIDIDKLRSSATSKLSLKITCLELKDYDVDKADILYNYIGSGLDLPDVDPLRPSKMQSFQNSVDDVASWLSGHKDDILQIYQVITQLIPKKS